MEFYIKKNSTLPIFQVEVFKNGRSDYDNNENLLDYNVYISLIDTETNLTYLGSKPCYITQSASTVNPDEIIYYINYQFTHNETKNIGRYEVEFSIFDNNTKIILPLYDKLYVNCMESFSADYSEYDNNYIISSPCCGRVLSSVIPIGVKGPALLFIEPHSKGSFVGNYMYGQGSSFFGFNNAIPPQNNSDIEKYFKMFEEYAGDALPNVITSDIPQTNGGTDLFGNNVTAYNFKTVQIPLNTIPEQAWYTWVIPKESINNLKQKTISYGFSANTLNVENMNTVIYSFEFFYNGNLFKKGMYSLYTTFVSSNFELDNSLNTLYFKGDSVG
jgi:hypothetical protein